MALSETTRTKMQQAGFDPDVEKYSTEYQRWVRSHVTSESCAKNGAKGYAATFAAGKGDVAKEAAATYRFERKTSDLEWIVIGWLCNLLHTDINSRRYREVRVGPFYVDFKFGGYIIEVNDETWHTNGFHGEDREGRDRHKYQYLSDQGYTIIILPEQAVRSEQALETLESLTPNLIEQLQQEF